MTNEQLEKMDVHVYADRGSAVVGFGVEEGCLLYIFYIDGYTQVVDVCDVGVDRFMMIVKAAFEGRALDYLGSQYAKEVFYDENLTSVAYLDYLAQREDD